LLDSFGDDGDIEWKTNPFHIDSINEQGETPEQLMSKITFEGLPLLQIQLKALILEFIDVFATKVRPEPVAVKPMKKFVDEDNWSLPCNRTPPHKRNKGIIKES
jgi:hypothetical protein